MSCPETQDKHLAMSQNSNLLTHSPPNKTSPTKNYHPAIMAPITLQGKTWICLPIVCLFFFLILKMLFLFLFFSSLKNQLADFSTFPQLSHYLRVVHMSK